MATSRRVNPRVRTFTEQFVQYAPRQNLHGKRCTGLKQTAKVFPNEVAIGKRFLQWSGIEASSILARRAREVVVWIPPLQIALPQYVVRCPSKTVAPPGILQLSCIEGISIPANGNKNLEVQRLNYCSLTSAAEQSRVQTRVRKLSGLFHIAWR